MTQSEAPMTNPSIHPCPVCGNVPKLANQQLHLGIVIPRCVCLTYAAIDAVMWQERCMYEMHNALHELGIETVEQVRELVGIACDACDERTVRATNRAENLVPLLRRRAAKGEK